jgi:hypothetical protein
VLLTVAGVASAVCSLIGIEAWILSGAAAEHSIAQKLFCIFPALSFVAFFLYLLRPLPGLLASWLIPTGTYISSFLFRLRLCGQGGCTTSDSIHVAWVTLARGWRLEAFLLAPALCLMLDYTRSEPAAIPAVAPESADHDLRT